MLYKNVKILRDTNLVITKQVPSHEVPILLEIWGQRCVTVEPGFALTRKPYLANKDEHDRLSMVYGDEVVDHVYGPRSENRIDAAIPLLARIASGVMRLKPEKKYPPAPIYVAAASEESIPRCNNEGLKAAIDEALALCETHKDEQARFIR